VDALPSLITPGSKPHPLLAELRQVRGQLQSLYGALFMHPRSRSSSRLTEEQMRQAAGARQDEDDFGEFLSGKARFFRPA
jgi:hypothetical protein